MLARDGGRSVGVYGAGVNGRGLGVWVAAETEKIGSKSGALRHRLA